MRHNSILTVAAAAMTLLAGVAVAQDSTPGGPTMTGSPSNCNKWYTVQSGDSCGSVASKFGISTSQFFSWNPAVSTDCTKNFWVGEAYCVGVGKGSTKPTGDPTPGGPTMTGSPSNCNAWYTVKSGDSCASVESKFSISSAQFLQWNPAVSSDCSKNFWVGEAYCVGTGAAKPATTTASKGKASTGDPAPGGPTMTGSPSNCNSWYTVVSGDSCASVAQKFGISSSQFLQWNPAISSDCSKNFWVGESYCVGTGSPRTTIKTTTTTTSKTTSYVSTPYSTRYPITSQNISTPTIPTDWPPKRTQAGEPSYCNNWHYVSSGDTCQNIVNQYAAGMTLDSFYAWNPAVGTDCSGLFNGYFVCVGIQPQDAISLTWYPPSGNATAPSSTAWTSSTLPTINSSFTATPQQTGIPSSCQSFYQAAANDDCNTVLNTYPYITKTQFMSWNPALNGNCQGLWKGYWYCVANFGSSGLPQPPTVTSPGSPAPTDSNQGCKAWYQTTGSDDCDSIAQIFGTFSSSDFISWNPSVGNTCDSIQIGYYYCVGVSGTPTTRTSKVTTTTQPTSVPTQSGTVSGCKKYWFVSSSDTCKSISQGTGISLTQFEKWNPAVVSGDDCVLTPDYNVCVSA